MNRVSRIVASCCVLLLFYSDVNAQKEGFNNRRSARPALVRDKLDLNQIFGRCGCENCGGRLEHNDPNNPEVGDIAGFQLVNRWTATAMSGGGLGQGDPAIVTWSIVPDGTNASGTGIGSNLIATFDGLFGGPNVGSPDLTNRFWFTLIEQALDRWAEVSGIVYVYEPNDDGAPNFGAGGFVGVRGDVRIGGFGQDGPGGTLAFNSFPNIGDMAIDTSDLGLFGSPAAGFRLFRNVFTHEQGHGIGFAHVVSNNAAFLMAPFISGAFDGPQLDDIRAAQRNYGDFNEKSNNFAGNNTIANATEFATLEIGQSQIIGTAGATGTVVGGAEVDFVSVDDNSDVDFYRVTLPEAAFLNVTLTPVGATYNQSAEGGPGATPLNASTTSNLTLALFSSTGSQIALVNDNGAGDAEVITDQIVAPGDVFVRVTGTANNVQLYTLEVSADEINLPQGVGPTAVTVKPGMIAPGGLNDLADLTSSDDLGLDIIPLTPGSPTEPAVAATFTFVAADIIPAVVSLSMESSSNAINVVQTVSVFSNEVNSFVEIDMGPASFTDENLTVNLPGDPQQWVQFPSGIVFVQVTYAPVGPVLLFPWTVSIDEMVISTLD